MKILYGVQATGNGHITRARAMVKSLQNRTAKVDFLFSGRKPDQLFDMEEFGDFRVLPGVTFVTHAGKVRPWSTINDNNFSQLFRDIKNLDLSPYDLVITDFEPISAWAARKQKVKSLAIGHQYAFHHQIPKKGSNPANALFMKNFAPAEIELGLHWHHFNQAILPPIADTCKHEERIEENKILVYLGFENTHSVLEFLKPFKDYEFYVYAAFDQASDHDHLHLRPLSRTNFTKDLATSNGVISNAGFELASEAIHLGKKLLVKPLRGQMEQLSNALALKQLDLGMTMDRLDSRVLNEWLNQFNGKRIVYPNVSNAIADWIISGDWNNLNTMIDSLWETVDFRASTNSSFQFRQINCDTG